MSIDRSALYELPWSTHNNPNGWIEPTTHCQLKCPHCYRLTDREGFIPGHRDLEEVTREIDELIRVRNIQTLTISGGEPLMYPHLDDVIRHARKRGLVVMVLTNGILLDRDRLVSLKELGTTRVVIHVQQFQRREGYDTEADLNRLRTHFCGMFREVGGVTLGFIMTLSSENVGDLDMLIPFMKENADVIAVAFFTILQEACPGETLDPAMALPADDLFERIRDLYGLEYCTYIRKSRSDRIAWLAASLIFSGTRYLGSADGQLYRFIQEDNLRKEGRYLYVGEKSFYSLRFFLFALFNRSLRRVFFRYLFRGTREPLHQQTVIVLRTPEPTPDGWDVCRGCPDAMFLEGRLVPSCILEAARAGETVRLPEDGETE